MARHSTNHERDKMLKTYTFSLADVIAFAVLGMLIGFVSAVSIASAETTIRIDGSSTLISPHPNSGRKLSDEQERLSENNGWPIRYG